MTRCHSCGRNEIPEGGRYCPGCGHQLGTTSSAAAMDTGLLLHPFMRRGELDATNGHASFNSDTALALKHAEPAATNVYASSSSDTTLILRLPLKDHWLGKTILEEDTLALQETDETAIISVPREDNVPSLAITPSEIEQVAATIESLWEFLDKEYEQSNRNKLTAALQDAQKPDVMRQVASLAGIIGRNMLARYMSGSRISNEQIQGAMMLGQFALQYSAANAIYPAQKRLLLLEALEQMRAGTLNHAEFASEFQQLVATQENGKGLAKLVSLVTAYLAERRKAGVLEREEAEAWGRIFATLPKQIKYEYEQFVKEVRLHSGLETSLPQRIKTPPVVISKRVGLFVDLENIWPFAAAKINSLTFGHILIEYAAQFGDVVCRWACANPPQAPGLQKGIELAGFQFRFPSEELQKGPRYKNMADFVLLESIIDERDKSQPDVYIIASGDQDFFERIGGLLRSGYTVRLLASKGSSHLSSKYYELDAQRKLVRAAQGHAETDFFIDDLDELLRWPPSRQRL